jgi:hypothetical protein
VSAATGKPLSAVSTSIEKALGGQTNALAKLDPSLKDLIKDGMSASEAMAALNDKFGGAAQEAANTTAGQFKRASLAFSETKESIGAALIPVLEKMLPYLQKFAEWAQKNPTLIAAVAAGIGVLAVSILAVNAAMALNPFTLITAGIIALIGGLALAYKKFEGFRNVVRTVVNGIAAYFEFMVNAWVKVINTVIKGINLVKPGKDIGFIGEIKIGRLGEENATEGLSASRITALATGGIVTSPTLAMIAEAGEPEAVIPLSKLNQFTNGNNGGGNVTIHVNGGDPNAVVEALRKYYRQNGPIPVGVSY